MLTGDSRTVRPQEKTGAVVAPRATVPLLAVIGAVVIILAAVVAFSLLVGGPVHEVHDSWMNVPALSVDGRDHARLPSGHHVPVFPASSSIHDSWMTTGVVPAFENFEPGPSYGTP